MPYIERKKIQVTKSVTAGVLRVFWMHTRRYPWSSLIILVTTSSVGILGVIIPLFYKHFFDSLAANTGILTKDAMATLLSILFIIAGLNMVAWLARRITGFTSSIFQSRIMRDLTDTAFRNLLGHSYRFFSDNFSGSLVRKVSRLARAFEDIADQIEFGLIPLFITFGGILFVLFRRETLLGTVLAVGTAIFLGVHLLVARWKQKFDLKKSEKDSEATGVLADALSNSTTIKSFAREVHEIGLYRKVIEELRKLRLFSWSINEGIDATQGLMMIAIEFAMLYSAIILWQRGILTIGDFALIQVYLISLFNRLWEFGRILRKIYEGIADAAEMVEILKTPHEIKDKPAAHGLLAPSGKIEFINVDFAFQETRYILKKFNLAVNSGEKIALVGLSGAGKTTIAKLLMRFHDVSAGEILIDGQNIADVTQQSLREKIALVPQEPILFHRTLKENILYGKMDATDEDVINAAKKAHCHEFITQLPFGYDTYVGERGIKLSGGERQRIAIARAILKNAPILVLDEATSSLDSESESLIQDALEKLMKGKTAIVIAHRLSTVMKMDRIIVISKGRVATTGTHKSLINKKGIYKTLWEIQAGGFMK